MKNILSILFWGVVFALVWAAGHDILNDEPDVRLEWAIVVAGLGLAGITLFRKLRALRSAA
jgi:hypothetical protein